MKSIFTSIWTTIMGTLVTICGGLVLTDTMPEGGQAVIGGLCMVLIGLGLIKAKDSDVSNSGTNAAPHKVK